MYVFYIVVTQTYTWQRVLLREQRRCITRTKSEYRVDDTTADGSAGAETFASQHLDVRIADKRTHLLRQRLTGPSVAIQSSAKTVRKKEERDERYCQTCQIYSSSYLVLGQAASQRS